MNEETYKPTLSSPVNKQSANVDKSFKPVMNNISKLKEGEEFGQLSEEELNEVNSMLNEAEKSLKKKIFSLPKMEALVFSDPKLTAAYDNMAVNGSEKFGYHYNETIHNILFNDYVLNSSRYLQKYKMAIPKEGEARRDKSGINHLKAIGRKKMDKTGTNVVQPDLEPKEVDETTGAASSGSYSPAIGLQDKSVGISETTSASSAGGSAGYVGYAGPAAWSKQGDLSGDFKKNNNKAPIISKPIYKGGTIVTETKNYLIDASGFEKMVNILNEQMDRHEEDNYVVDKANAFTSYNVKKWDSPDMNIEMNTLKTGKMDNANLKTEGLDEITNPGYGSIKTIDQIKALGRKLTKEDIPMLGGDALYAVAMSRANKMLPLRWDDLADVNSMWDYIKPNGGMTSEQLTAAVKRAVAKRIKAEGYTMRELGLGEGENKAVDNNEFFEITTPLNSCDARMFTQVVNQGIDSHLEGFTKSEFTRDGNRLVLNFHKTELPLLLRRLEELGTEEADSWKYDIENYKEDDPNMDYLNEKNVAVDETSPGYTDLRYDDKLVNNRINQIRKPEKPSVDPKSLERLKSIRQNNTTIKETTQSMIDSNETSMANKPVAVNDPSQGMDMGMASQMNEGAKLLEEINNELNAFSIHQEKLKRMTEDKKPSSIILKDRLGNDNQANFKKDLEHSGTKKIIDVQKDLQWKDQQTEIGKDAQKLGMDIEKEVLKKTKGQSFDNVGDSANLKGNEIPKRNMTGDEVKQVDMYRLGMSDLQYDNLVGKRFEDRMKTDMGDDIYKQRNEKMKFRSEAPMYNKDTQPTEKGEKKEQYGKGINESVVTGRYFDYNGKSHMIDFRLGESIIAKEKSSDWSSISFDGLGNSYANKLNTETHKLDINEGVVDMISTNKFYINPEDNVVYVVGCSKSLNETVTNKEVKITNLEKMKHLGGYNANKFVDNTNSKINRGF